MTTDKISLSGISVKINGEKKSTLEQSKELAAKLAEKVLTKAEKPKKTQKSTTAAAPKTEALLTATIPKDKRSAYQNRAYLHPSFNDSRFEGKLPDIIALKTLCIDENKRFHLWNTKSATEFIRNFIEREHPESFTTDTIDSKAHVWGGGISDISLRAARKLAKEGILEIQKADAKRLSYIFKVVKK